MEQIIATVRGFDGAFVLVPEAGGGLPEIAWGDAFCYYAPDGRMLEKTQPYATAVTKDHPYDSASDLDPPGRWRVNIHVGRTRAEELVGPPRRADDGPVDHTAADTVLPHPVYGALGWICVVDPGPRTTDLVLRLLRSAHEAARARHERGAERRTGRTD
ncbi:hypothetical protein SZN_13551 [Streptomyces zinciresistens K42]|uniref:DUF6194 domain-containing protein n=1 Tax=Streptomyces zinciresistens K42 TaxID=700597 RepID=G2GB54_9ACTN|nr:DUF6194 family protein [Streptomyces zinciresistens]EGX59231.1 hypothetical protein SZN_13551 [Streptomyces zinciresistens K42]